MQNSKKIGPGSTAFKRLFDARTHWLRAQEAYFSPEEFRIEINSCIQALRNVTFVLQSDKSNIPDFELWYEPWQNKLRADKKMRWSVEARNTIVKARDLELNSKLRVSLVGSYLDNELPTFQTEYSPEITTKALLKVFLDKKIPNEYLKNSKLRLERRWVIDKFPTEEFLGLLAYCWSFLSKILYDLASKFEQVSAYDRWELPPCMIDDGEFRSIWIKVSTGEISELDSKTLSTSLSEDDKANLIERYEIDKVISPPKLGNLLRDTANHFFEHAKNMLLKDGYHIYLVILLTHDKKASFLELRPEDRSDKYQMWRLVAAEVKKMHAHSIISIAEAWVASIEPGQKFIHAAEDPERKEALHLTAVSEDGTGFILSAPFNRVDGKIKLGETSESSLTEVNVNTIAPVLLVWKELAEAKNVGN